MTDDTFDPRDIDRHDPEWITLLDAVIEQHAEQLGERSREDVKAQIDRLCDIAKERDSHPLEIMQEMQQIAALTSHPLVIEAHRKNKATLARADWTIDNTILDLLMTGISVVEQENRITAQLEDLLGEDKQ